MQAVNLRHHFFAIQAVAPGMRGGRRRIDLQLLVDLLHDGQWRLLGLHSRQGRDHRPERGGLPASSDRTTSASNALMPGWVITERQRELWVGRRGEPQGTSEAAVHSASDSARRTWSSRPCSWLRTHPDDDRPGPRGRWRRRRYRIGRCNPSARQSTGNFELPRLLVGESGEVLASARSQEGMSTLQPHDSPPCWKHLSELGASAALSGCCLRHGGAPARAGSRRATATCRRAFSDLATLAVSVPVPRGTCASFRSSRNAVQTNLT